LRAAGEQAGQLDVQTTVDLSLEHAVGAVHVPLVRWQYRGRDAEDGRRLGEDEVPVLAVAREHHDVHVLRCYVGSPSGAHLGEVLSQSEVLSVEALTGAHRVEEVRERVGEAMLQELLVLRRQLAGPCAGGDDQLHLEPLCSCESHDGADRGPVQLRQVLVADQRVSFRDAPQAPEQSCQRVGFAGGDEAAAGPPAEWPQEDPLHGGPRAQRHGDTVTRELGA
jgi:hypothetical protein